MLAADTLMPGRPSRARVVTSSMWRYWPRATDSLLRLAKGDIVMFPRGDNALPSALGCKRHRVTVATEW